MAADHWLMVSYRRLMKGEHFITIRRAVDYRRFSNVPHRLCFRLLSWDGHTADRKNAVSSDKSGEADASAKPQLEPDRFLTVCQRSRYFLPLTS